MKTSRNILFLALFSVTFPVGMAYSGVDFENPKTEVENVEEDTVEVPDTKETKLVELEDLNEVAEEDSDAMDKFFKKKSTDDDMVAAVVVEEKIEVMTVEKTPVFKDKDCDDMAEEKDAAMDMALKRMDQLEEELDSLSGEKLVDVSKDGGADAVVDTEEEVSIVEEDGEVKEYDVVLKKYKPVFKVSRRSSAVASSESEYVQKLKDLKSIINENRDSSDKDEILTYILNSINESYTSLLDVSSACCESSLSNEFRRDGASYGARYDYLINDIKTEEVQEFCMFYSDADISRSYRSSEELRVLSNAKNGCVCKNKDYINSELELFRKLFTIVGEKDFDIIYKYDNIMGKKYDIDMTTHIKNLEKSLEYCY